MTRHRTDFVSLAFGLIFVALGVVFVGGRTNVDLGWVTSWSLAITGLVVGALALNRHGRRTETTEHAAGGGQLLDEDAR